MYNIGIKPYEKEKIKLNRRISPFLKHSLLPSEHAPMHWSIWEGSGVPGNPPVALMLRLCTAIIFFPLQFKVRPFIFHISHSSVLLPHLIHCSGDTPATCFWLCLSTNNTCCLSSISSPIATISSSKKFAFLFLSMAIPD